jgi:hypothetical protein
MGGRRSKKKATKERLRVPGPSKQILKIQQALSLDLLVAPYRAEPSDRNAYIQATKGHCYVATEAAYHLFGKKAGFVPFVCKHDDGTTHWWLQNSNTGAILDPTAPQLNGNKSVYKKGRRGSFLTKKPSKRAAELIRRVKRSQK